jgi:hypothetical protein
MKTAIVVAPNRFQTALRMFRDWTVLTPLCPPMGRRFDRIVMLCYMETYKEWDWFDDVLMSALTMDGEMEYLTPPTPQGFEE